MSINLNKASQFLDEAGTFPATITSAKMDWTKNGVECVVLVFCTDDEREINASYTEKMYWKLKRVAMAAGIPEANFEEFEPELLTGKKVIIKTVKTQKEDKEFTNVSEVFAFHQAATPIKHGDEVPF
jgi:hypothetical protein